MPIRQILKPCATCGESLIFGHFAPQGDVQPAGNGMSRVCCPSCNTEGPLGESFREACSGWNLLTDTGSARIPAVTAIDSAAAKVGRGTALVMSSANSRTGS